MHVSRLRVPLLPRPVRVAAVAAVALFLLYASVVTPPSSGVPDRLLGVGVDKWLHVAAYAGLAGTLGYARLTPGSRLGRRSLAVVFAATLAYGLGIELVQAFLPARAFALADVVANGVGAAAGAAPWRFLRG